MWGVTVGAIDRVILLKKGRKIYCIFSFSHSSHFMLLCISCAVEWWIKNYDGNFPALRALDKFKNIHFVVLLSFFFEMFNEVLFKACNSLKNALFPFYIELEFFLMKFLFSMILKASGYKAFWKKLKIFKSNLKSP